MRSTWLAIALLPYLLIAGFDAWMHEKARSVPRVEQWAHAGLAVSLGAFLVSVFRGEPQWAALSLAVFAALVAFDEIGFHRAISRLERRVHFAS